MNEIVNKILLVGDKYMPEMHLKHPGFTHSACGPFTKKKERIEKFIKKSKKKQTNKQTLFIKMNLIKLVFNMTWLMANQKIY